MKKLSFLFIAVFLCVSSITTFAVGQRSEPIITRSFPAASIQSVEAHTRGGNITVTGNADSQATVEVFATNSFLSSSRIKELFEENYTIDISEENGKLTVTATRARRLNPDTWDRRGNRNHLSISFRINVPSDVSSDLRTSGGNIRLNNLIGDSHNFQTSGGSLSVENVSGNISGRTSGGSITAQNCSGAISLRTSGGSIRISNLNGDIEVRTSGGSIRADDIQGTLAARTSGGSVNLNRLSGNVEASTSGGSMSVGMTSVNDFVRLSTSGGNITLEVPANQGYNLDLSGNRIRTSGMGALVFSGNFEQRRRLNGTVDGGGTEIRARAQRVNLNFR